jgi:Holliday junction resolvasome RuvABC ATP-dependent DNA helicase subunit
LGQALANHYGTECTIVFGKCSPSTLCEHLIKMKKGDFLFLDECHALPESSQELLYPVLDDKGWVTDCLGANAPNAARTPDGKLVVQPITIILASNKIDKM